MQGRVQESVNLWPQPDDPVTDFSAVSENPRHPPRNREMSRAGQILGVEALSADFFPDREFFLEAGPKSTRDCPERDIFKTPRPVARDRWSFPVGNPAVAETGVASRESVPDVRGTSSLECVFAGWLSCRLPRFGCKPHTGGTAQVCTLELTPFVPEARDREPRGGRMRSECRWQVPVASPDCVSTGRAQRDERDKSHSTNANPTGGVAVRL